MQKTNIALASSRAMSVHITKPSQANCSVFAPNLSCEGHIQDPEEYEKKRKGLQWAVQLYVAVSECAAAGAALPTL